jgi:hypothetical protein
MRPWMIQVLTDITILEDSDPFPSFEAFLDWMLETHRV